MPIVTEEALIDLGLKVAALAEEVCDLIVIKGHEELAELLAASRAFGEAYSAWMSGEEL